MKNRYIYTAIAVLLGLVAAFFAGFPLQDRGADRLILRLGLAFVVIVAAASFLVYMHLKEQSSPEAAAKTLKPLKAGDELELLLREAESKLAGARVSEGSKLSDFPVLFLIGPEGAAKTSSIIHSGVEPELLAGQVYRENAVTPTGFLNVWFARKALFVEAAEKVTGDPASWVRLIRRVVPGKLGAAVSKGRAAGRAAVVYLDVERLLRPGAAETMAGAARAICGQLTQISQTLGVSTPVYVLFTKIDRVPFFYEYAGVLGDDEASGVLGCTLPIKSSPGKGSYGEEQTSYLTQQFNRLFYSLCDHRPEYLSRESDNQRTAAIYEFPREFRKMRTALVAFLVEVCRPSQLTIGPFLRGFYFSGVRPVIVQEAAFSPAARPVAQQAFQPESGATGMFRVGQAPAHQAIESLGSSVASKKVPQWVFLSQFFQKVLLADDRAMGVSGTSVKTSALRKVLLGTLGIICLIFSVMFVVSYLNNRELESRAIAAANAIAAVPASNTGVPSLDSLQRLEMLRQSLERLTAYTRQGAPLSLRWGLYSGDKIYPDVRQIYFQAFQKLLLSPTQSTLVAEMKALPAAPGQKDEYNRPYDTLKSYLITTSHHEKSTKSYLAPVLESRWAEKRGVDAARAQLAQRQFDFYSEELALANPFSSANDSGAIEHARRYLAQFAGAERVYQFMLSEANRANEPINFNRQIPGSEPIVVNNRDVPGAFTKGGWTTMQKAFKNLESYFNGEPWVLGDNGSGAAIDKAALESELSQRYAADFVKAWRDYLARSTVVKYASLSDAATKLSTTSGSSSPLLALFWVASQNVAVDSPDVGKNFKALDSVMPPNSMDYVGPGNKDYMSALSVLQSAVEQVAAEPGPVSDAAAAPVLDKANAARQITKTMALAFGTDPAGHDVSRILEDPITQVQGLLKGLGPAELNGKGKQLCDQFRQVSSKYPFNPNAAVDATLDNVNAIFKPKDGAFWAFYNANLLKLLPKQGNSYVADPAAPVHLTPSFVAFFNRAAAFSDAIYAGTPDPHFTYSIKPVKAEGTDSTILSIDGQTLSFSGTAAKQFVWSGASHEVKGSLPPLPGYFFDKSGLWAIFRFFGTADTEQPTGPSTAVYGRIIRSNQGPIATVRFELDMGANPPILHKGYLSSLSCVADVAK
jgi:type VI secretion system protein ImpL